VKKLITSHVLHQDRHAIRQYLFLLPSPLLVFFCEKRTCSTN